MASVLLLLENLSEDKHVESVLLPRSDTGSNPVSSTFVFLSKLIPCQRCFLYSSFVRVFFFVNILIDMYLKCQSHITKIFPCVICVDNIYII